MPLAITKKKSSILSKGTKTIRGLLRGSKDKKKKKKKVSHAEAPKGMTSHPSSTSLASKMTYSDEMTVYNVELDASTVATPAPPTVIKKSSKRSSSSKTLEESKESKESKKDSMKEKSTVNTKTSERPSKDKEKALQIVLLLMDKESRRFELIQLSFDAKDASVNEILKQIPASATEESLREQTYESICLTNGVQMMEDTVLEKYLEQIANSNNILLAVPNGMTAAECRKLSIPILDNDMVKSMLKGVELPRKTSSKSVTVSHSSTEDKSQSASGDLPKSDTTSTTSGTHNNTESTTKSNVANLPPAFKPYSSTFLTYIMLVILIPVLMSVQGRITSPLSPGDNLPVGQWRSTCGILSALPEQYSGCHGSKILEMTEDGLLTLTELNANEGREDTILWQMKGSCSNDENMECMAEIDQDGQIMIGGSPGKPVKGVGSSKDDIDLTPWPFTIYPDKNKRKNR